MTIPDQTDLADSQREVQRLFGRCLLRLQQYEILLKSMVARQAISATSETLVHSQSVRRADVAGRTLGNLVGQLMGGYIMRAGSETDDVTPDHGSDVSHFSFRMHLSLPSESYEALETDLRELVKLRNTLVHHFIEQQDLWTVDGCLEAEDFLCRSYAEVDRQFERLRGFASNMDETRKRAAEALQSPQLQEMIVNGIGPDGQVYWPMAGIVYTLRRACQELAIDGWVNLQDAMQWATVSEPEQTPKKYGCARWRHVIHECGQFELRRFTHNGRSGTWFRARHSTAD